MFPDPRDTEDDGLLAIGGKLTVPALQDAYSQGVFPWPLSTGEAKRPMVLAWFCPPERGVLDFSELRISDSLARALKKKTFEFTVNQDFPRVIDACAEQRRESGTWITDSMSKTYIQLHRQGLAHSVEAWLAGELVGGIYGVCIAGYFAGESMFYKKPNASKLALLHLIECLKGRGFEWMDIQMLTPHMEKMGAKLVQRDEFLLRLARAASRGLTFS